MSLGAADRESAPRRLLRFILAGFISTRQETTAPGRGSPRYNRDRMDVYEELVRLRNLGQRCALATIVEVRGSIPSYESAKLLVREDGSMVGTIGGGCVEAEVWNAAREVMQTEQPRRLTFNLGQDAAYDNGLICGGQLDVFVEPVMPIPHAYIFGAGHISKSLSKVATLAGFATCLLYTSSPGAPCRRTNCIPARSRRPASCPPSRTSSAAPTRCLRSSSADALHPAMWRRHSCPACSWWGS